MKVRTDTPSTGFRRPTREDAERLHAIVVAAKPELRDVSFDDFWRGFWGVGHMFRLAAPSKKHSPSWLLGHVNDMLGRADWLEIDGDALFCAVLAHADVCWQRADPSRGLVFELGLAPFSGIRCSNRWADLLRGTANLLPPTPASAAVREASEPSRVRYFQADRAGRMQPLSANQTLWEQH